jgi:hypothetical protein
LVATNVSPVHPDVILNYVDSATLVPQAALSATFFTNPFLVECGVITTCVIKTQGCSAPYTGDKLTIDATTGKVESK